MIKAILTPLLFVVPFILQDADMTRHVVRTHKNGQPYVVVYTVGKDYEKVKEELFYDNGQLDYVGHYQKGVEHGIWTYYWPNGNLKAEEYYEKGLEEGIMYDYDENGKKIKEYRYVKGRLMKETVLN